MPLENIVYNSTAITNLAFKVIELIYSISPINCEEQANPMP